MRDVTSKLGPHTASTILRRDSTRPTLRRKKTARSKSFKLSGTVRKVEVSPPHPWLDVETPNDGVWRVELGNPSQTERSGFVTGSAKLGDTVQATGNRARDHKEKRMKAVQITVGDKTYDIYPERIGKQ